MDPSGSEDLGRRRLLKILGWISLGLGCWGLYNSFVVVGIFQQLDISVSGSGRAGGFTILGLPMAPVVVAYWLTSATLMLLGGVGLLKNYRWGPLLAAPAGISWSITSATILLGSIWLLSLLGFGNGSPLVRNLRALWIVHAGCALLVLIFAVALGWAVIRQRWPFALRHGLGLIAWGGVSGGISWYWCDWYVHLLIP